MKEKCESSILGFVVGDALGVPVEFKSRASLTNHPVKDMLGYMSHNVPEGTWSDDTSLVLATMDSLQEKNGVDYDDIMEKFIDWYTKNYYTATGKVFDIGITTSQAFERYYCGYPAVMCGLNNERSNGNGSLMRILPLTFYLKSINANEKEQVDMINKISSLTHAHEISCLGCKIFNDYVMFLLDGLDKFEALEALKQINYLKYYSKETVDKYARILKDNLSNYKVDEISSSGYVVSTLEAVLWTTLNTNSYEEALQLAVNLGDDTDTVGAITGGVNGIIYGKEAIPKRWLDNIKNKELLVNLIEKFNLVINEVRQNGRV